MKLTTEGTERHGRQLPYFRVFRDSDLTNVVSHSLRAFY
jgi:hypothetical protein